MREHGTTDWYLQAEVDLNKGIKPVLTGQYTKHGWKQENSTNYGGGTRGIFSPDVLYTQSEPLTTIDQLITYEANSGVSDESLC